MVREEIRNWPELSDVLKRTVWWPIRQVRAGNAMFNAFYVVSDSGCRSSITSSGEVNLPCSYC